MEKEMGLLRWGYSSPVAGTISYIFFVYNHYLD